MSPLLARARFAVVAARLAADAVAWGLGFRAVSDDDFARVVIAQGFARTPQLDPSGTSWLPLPFWLTGSIMAVVGRELLVARAVALALGVVASLLIFESARWLLGATPSDPGRRALAGAVIATALPWSARLGIATVPELLAAACTLFAAASMAPGGPPTRRLVGAIALGAACLCRYEPWFVVVPFATFTIADAVRARDARRDRRTLAIASGAALVAPAAWIAWNHHAHGDALAFVARVASYKRALGEGNTGLLDTAKGTLASLVSAEPELSLAALFLLVGARLVAKGAIRVPPAWKRPLLVFAVAIAGLVAAGARDGAPTHHPERALLAPILLAAVLVGAAGHDAFARVRTLGAGAAFGLAAIAIVTGGWFARHWWRPVGALADREDHVLVGADVAKVTRPGDKVLVEVADYGYFAVLAGGGRPEDFVPDRSLDPRGEIARSSFESAERLEARVRETGAVAIVGRRAALGGRCRGTFREMCWAEVALAGGEARR